MNWSVEASQELLQLRFREFRTLFDDAQTVAGVHEAWGVVASTLNKAEVLELQVDAVKCSDQLTKLRQQWQNSNSQLHVMMTECFSPQRPEQRGNFNRVMEEAMVDTSPKRKKARQTETVEEVCQETEVASDAASDTCRAEDSSPCQDEAPESLEQVSDVEQEAPSSVEEFPRQDEIMCALEKRSEHLERLAKSHQHLADVTLKLMEVLVNRQDMTS